MKRHRQIASKLSMLHGQMKRKTQKVDILYLAEKMKRFMQKYDHKKKHIGICPVFTKLLLSVLKNRATFEHSFVYMGSKRNNGQSQL